MRRSERISLFVAKKMSRILLIVVVLSCLCGAFAAKIQAPPKQDSCSLCKYIVGIVETWVENNATEEEIQQFLDQVCQFTPDPSDCVTFVNENLANIIAWLEQNEDADQICTQLGLCTSKIETPKPKPSNLKNLKDAECDNCQAVIKAIEYWMTQNQTEQEFEEFFESTFCTWVADWQQTCNAIVEQGWPQVLAWINEYENPLTVCQQLTLCTSKLSHPKQVAKPIKFIH